MDLSDQDDDFNPFSKSTLDTVLDLDLGSSAPKEDANFPLSQTSVQVPATPEKTAISEQASNLKHIDDQQKAIDDNLRNMARIRDEFQETGPQRAAPGYSSDNASSTYNPNGPNPKNFPKFPSWCPIRPFFYINIEREIPPAHQQLCVQAHYVFYAFTGLLGFNFFIFLMGLIVGMTGGLSGFIYSLINCVIMIPLSLFFFFPRLYSAIRNTSSLSYMIFFGTAVAKIIFLAVFIVGMSTGMAGWSFSVTNMQGDKSSGTSKIVGGLSAFSALAATGLFIFIGFLLKKVFAVYKSAGGSFQNATNEMNRTVPGAMINSAVANIR